MAKTRAEQIESVKAKIQQLENQKKELLQKENEEARKARTKRLIRRGAFLESLIPGGAQLTDDRMNAFLLKTVATDNARKILDGLTAQDGAAANVKAAVTEQRGG